MKLTDKIRLAAPIFFLKADNICDKIPLLSTLTNLVDLIAKGILLRDGDYTFYFREKLVRTYLSQTYLEMPSPLHPGFREYHCLFYSP